MYIIMVRDVLSLGKNVMLEGCMQYDHNIGVQFEGDMPEQYSLEECCKGDPVAKPCEMVSAGLFKIDNELLKDGRDITLYLYYEGDAWGRTCINLWIPMTRRPARGGSLT